MRIAITAFKAVKSSQKVVKSNSKAVEKRLKRSSNCQNGWSVQEAVKAVIERPKRLCTLRKAVKKRLPKRLKSSLKTGYQRSQSGHQSGWKTVWTETGLEAVMASTIIALKAVGKQLKVVKSGHWDLQPFRKRLLERVTALKAVIRSCNVIKCNEV